MRKKRSSAEEPAPSVQQETPESKPEKSSSSPDKLGHIGFKVTNGKIDFNSVRASRADSIKEIVKNSINDDSFRQWAGLTSDTPKLQIHPRLIHQALEMIATIETGVYASKTGLSHAEIEPVVAWTDREHELLDEQGAMLASEFIPLSWMKYTPILMFSVTMFTCLKMKHDAVNKLVESKLKKMVPGDVKAPAPPKLEIVTDPFASVQETSPSQWTEKGVDSLQ